MRFGLADLIAQEPDLEVCAEADNRKDAVATIRETQPDGVVLGIDIPGGQPLEVVREIGKACPKAKILIVSKNDDSHLVLRTMRAGAAGFLTKQNAWEQLREGLRRVLDGGVYLGDDFAHRLIFQQLSEKGYRKGDDCLTLREREILDLLGEKLSTREIAEKLGISGKTVETYRGHIKEKFDLHSGRALTEYAEDRAVQRE